MTDDTQPEAMDLADWLEAVGGGPSAKRCAALLREQHTRIAELEAQIEALSGVQALSAAPGVTSEQRRLIGVIADKIEDGTLFQSGIYPKKDLARFVRNMLDVTPTAPAASPTPPAEQQAAPKAAPGELSADSLRHQNKLLAETLGACILASGIVRKDIDGFTGPELLHFGEDLRSMLEVAPQPAPAEQEEAAQRLRKTLDIDPGDVNGPLHPRYIAGFKSGHAAGRRRAAPAASPTPTAEQQAAPKAAPGVGNSGFDHKTAADFLNGKTVSDEAVRNFVATSRWAHDERAALSATLLAMHGVLTSREAEIALLKKALLEAEAAPQQEAQEPCPTCVALARTVMLDQVSFDRKPDCYGIRQITDDEGVEEWEDIRTSPDVAREEANDMMATGRGEIYEVVPLYTAPLPAPAPLSEMPYEKRKAIQEGEQIGASDAWFHARHNMLDTLDRRNVFRAGFDRGWNAALAAQGGE